MTEESESKIKNILLKPFELLNPPRVELPTGFIQIPSLKLVMPIIFISFAICAGGVIHCFVNGMPLLGVIRRPDGKIVESCFSNYGLGSQFLAEGLIATGVYTLGSLSLLSAVYVIKNENRKDTTLYKIVFGFSVFSPIWILFSIMIFRCKIPQYNPALAIF